MSGPASPSPSYEELAALVVDLTSQLQLAQGRIAELEARLGRDSTNSSQPPSADSIAAKAKRRADRSSRERSALTAAAAARERRQMTKEERKPHFV